ncbi:hypothetical protein UCDDA912_g04718 [Diaporthe ampelina]|uniref:Uncharacterized protein n=1 Tax=Diaporthe ampelina TaxID=1214573 RepID=A0A0G2HJT4_9PEZI|nr:hypothetical protein UCDDA912_g04718 [Diaporthe ampelina]
METQQLAPITADEDNEDAGRLSRWLEQRELEKNNKYNRTVTISPLPDTATVADVLPRIRGGVDSCYVSQFEETRLAVVTFKLPADAITYAEFCAETPIWNLWTFEISRPGVPFTWQRRAKVELFKSAPGMVSVRERGDIPTAPRTVVLAGSRCLVYNECKPHEVVGIYRALGLHRSQHQRDQVEGMWLDGPVRDHQGNPIHGNLHIWYTSIKCAQEAKVRVQALDYEYDPCSDSPEKLLLHLDEGDEVPVFRHHEPFINLLELHQKTLLTGISEGIVNPVYAYWRCRAPVQAALDDMTSLAGRLQWSLQSNAGPAMMPTFPTTYQQPAVIPPPSALSDPFLDSRPIAKGFPPQPQSRGGTTAYTLGRLDSNIPINYQPFAAGRAVPPGHHLSPVETYVARTQERQALGYPPYFRTGQNELPYYSVQPPRSLTSGTNNSSHGIGTLDGMGEHADMNTTNKYSNLGGYNNPQSGRQPRSGFYDS